MSTPVPGVLSRRSHRRWARISCAPPVARNKQPHSSHAARARHRTSHISLLSTLAPAARVLLRNFAPALDASAAPPIEVAEEAPKLHEHECLRAPPTTFAGRPACRALASFSLAGNGACRPRPATPASAFSSFCRLLAANRSQSALSSPIRLADACSAARARHRAQQGSVAWWCCEKKTSRCVI